MDSAPPPVEERDNMQTRKHVKLGQLLVTNGMVQEWQFLAAMGARRPGQKLGEVMLEKKFLSEEQLAEAIAMQLDVQYVRLGLKADPKSVKAMPGHIARRFMVFPVAIREAQDGMDVPVLVVAMTDPTDARVIDALRFLLNVDVEPVLATKKDILKAISRTYGDDDPGAADSLPIPFPLNRFGRSNGAMSMNYAA
jgi:type IV pilus assembly protein PilB